MTVDVHTAKDLLGSGHHYLDVRSVEEFNKSHIDNALNVPYTFITEESNQNQKHKGIMIRSLKFLQTHFIQFPNKEDHLVVGCNSGGRSFRACVDLLNAGYKDVTNMGGGYSAWVDSGLASDKPPEELKTACKFRP
ncbi:hypothetical protein ACJW30_07G142200 [Castanea mollissima]